MGTALRLRVVPIRIFKQKQKQDLYHSLQIVTDCDCHNRLQSVNLDFSCQSGFFLVLLAKQISSQLVTIGHKRSQISYVTGTNLCFCFLFGTRIGINEIRQNTPESDLCFCFLSGIRIFLFVCLFVLFVCINPEKLYSASRPGREVKPLGVYPPALHTNLARAN
jgi:hypothetical protein